VGLAAPLGLTISLGLVWVGAGELAQVDGDDLLRLADQAMYAAKQAGRNLAIM
jgi:GGDEF domain-containing protein